VNIRRSVLLGPSPTMVDMIPPVMRRKSATVRSARTAPAAMAQSMMPGDDRAELALLRGHAVALSAAGAQERELEGSWTGGARASAGPRMMLPLFAVPRPVRLGGDGWSPRAVSGCALSAELT
jgi:hypothetical protein